MGVRVAVTGAGGMLATATVPALLERGHQVLAWTRQDLDVTDATAVRDRLMTERPDAVIQCAAFTRVDDAESDEDTARLINVEGTRNVGRAAAEIGARLVYPSTDYVFSGTSSRPYRPEDTPEPVSAYGRSKRAGELAASSFDEAVIVRTSWLYGAGGRNFVETITRLGREREQLEVVHDQVGRPTWTRSLARVIVALLESRAVGIFHATDAGEPITWFEFATEILRRQGIATPVIPVSSQRYPRPARRPAYSVLDYSATEAATGLRLPSWSEALAGYLASTARGR